MTGTNVHAPELYEPVWRNRQGRHRTPARDRFFRENWGVDPAMLADELGLSERFVRMYQRKMGLRKCTSSPRKGAPE